MMKQVVIVGITGKAGSGKDTIAKYLEATEGFIRIAIADGVRETFRGLDGPDWWLSKGMGMRPRRALQLLATECGREIDVLLWAKVFATKVRFLVENWVELGGSQVQETLRIVVPDVRFANEAESLRVLADTLSGACYIVRLWRGEAIDLRNEEAAHSSETSIDEIKVDGGFDNNGTRMHLCGYIWAGMRRRFDAECSTWNR